MNVTVVDVYQAMGVPKPEGAVGRLTCWSTVTPQRISPRRRRPAVLILPGGGYGRTSVREAEPVALRFVARGWAAFVLEYSCAPFRFPTALREAAMAMAFLRTRAEGFEVDPGKVAALGFSAGGHLCGTLGTLYDAPEVAELALPEAVRPDGLCLCYPVTVSRGPTHGESFDNLTGGDGPLRDRLSLDRLVRRDMPPVFLWHTRDDASVPCAGTLALAQALEAAGVSFALHIYRQGRHGLATADEAVYPTYAVPRVSRDVPGWLDAALAFFAEEGLVISDEEAP